MRLVLIYIGIKLLYLFKKKNLQIQLDLAIKYNLPVILHAREAFEEVYKILLPYKNKIKGVFHCLVNNLEEAQK
ncbi:MAG: TatD family hydrolase, partial [Sweet potato little leaf phytoplasma]|nr:TatD family hydrolase [Sweet potato little leaf phytoplasma]